MHEREEDQMKDLLKDNGNQSNIMQKKCGVKMKIESFSDVRLACDKWLRDRDLIKPIRELNDIQFRNRLK